MKCQKSSPIVRKDMDVKEHKILSNFVLKTQIKVEEQSFIAVLLFIVFSSSCHRQCELLPSLDVCLREDFIEIDQSGTGIASGGHVC
jgi:hypothetical protein